MPDTNISDDMHAHLGAELGRRVSYPVSDSDIRRWASAAYFPEPPPPEFWDADYAITTRHGGIVAPQEFNPFAWMSASESKPAFEVRDADPDRFEKRLGIAGPGLRFQLNGGIHVEYGALMRPGDVVTSVARLDGYTERAGRLGLMLFTVVEDAWTNQNNEMVKRSLSTLIRY